MDNVNQPMGQGPQEHSPTEPYRFTPGWPGGAQGDQGPNPGGPPPTGTPWPQNPPGPYANGPNGPQGPHGPQWQQAGPSPQPPKPKKSWKQEWKQSRRVRWTAGITAAALLGAGGAVGGLALAGSGGSGGSNATQATALNTAISSTGTNCPTPVAGSVHSKTGKHGCLRLSIRRVRGMYGQVAFHTKSGTETLAFERGTVASDSGGVIVVKARNGTEWSWNVASSSLVRESGKPVSSSQLASGAHVFVGGQVVGNNKDARLIIIHAPKSSSGGSGSSSGSSSSGSSSNSASNSSSGSAT